MGPQREHDGLISGILLFFLNKIDIFHCKPVNCDSGQCEDAGVNTEVLNMSKTFISLLISLKARAKGKYFENFKPNKLQTHFI